MTDSIIFARQYDFTKLYKHFQVHFEKCFRLTPGSVWVQFPVPSASFRAIPKGLCKAENRIWDSCTQLMHSAF